MDFSQVLRKSKVDSKRLKDGRRSLRRSGDFATAMEGNWSPDWCSLPAELWRDILQDLVHEHRATSLVCRKWTEQVAPSGLALNGDCTDGMAARLLIDVTDENDDGGGRPAPDQAAPGRGRRRRCQVPFARFVERLDLQGCRLLSRSTMDLLPGLPRLRDLVLSGCVLRDVDLAPLARCRGLRHLDLRHSGGDVTDATVLNHLPNQLRSVRLPERATNQALCGLFGRLPQLQRLDVGFCSAITVEGLALLGADDASVESPANDVADDRGGEWRLRDEPRPALRELCVGRSGIDGSSARQFAQGLGAVAPALRCLDLSFCFRLTDAALLGLVRQLSQLERLVLDSCYRITGLAGDDNQSVFAPLGGSLRALVLDNCHSVQDQGVAALADALPELRTLHLFSCQSVTEAGLRNVSRLVHLTDLSVAYLHVTEYTFIYTLSCLPRLRQLSCLQCSQLTDRCLTHLAGVDVRELNLYGCQRLTPACYDIVSHVEHVVFPYHLRKNLVDD